MKKPKRKTDGRRNNGRPATPNGETQTVVRCPLALLDAMRARAGAEHMPLAEAWRRAAQTWLLTRRD